MSTTIYNQAAQLTQNECAPLAAISDIVIVDDEAMIAACIAETLAEEGYAVRVFNNGTSAIAGITEQTPKLVLLDIAMPDINGDEVLRVLRRRGFGMPIILMSAHACLSNFLSQGATDTLSKPFDLDALLARVATYTK